MHCGSNTIVYHTEDREAKGMKTYNSNLLHHKTALVKDLWKSKIIQDQPEMKD